MSEKKFKTFADLKLVPPKPAENSPPISPANPATPTPESDSTLPYAAMPRTNSSQQDLLKPPAILPQPIAPVKNFHKVPNSVNGEALANGLFKTGAYKKIYDALYLLTRGAMNPTRTVNIKKNELMKHCSIGSRVTLDAGVEHLQTVGLIKYNIIAGSHTGNLFEVFLPEEISLTSQTRVSSLTSQAETVYFLDRLDTLESSQTRQSLVIENKDSYETAKTLIKTRGENDDDDGKKAQIALAGFAEKLSEVFVEIGGQKLNLSDAENLTAIAEILANELRSRQKFTKTISKPSAFLARHLKTLCLQNAAGEKKSIKTPIKPDTIGKGTDEPLLDMSHLPSDLDPQEYPEYCFACGWLHEECRCQKK